MLHQDFYHLREIFVCVKSDWCVCLVQTFRERGLFKLNFMFRKRSSSGGRYLRFSSVEEMCVRKQVCRDVKILMFDFVFQSVKIVLAFFGKISKVLSALNMKLLEQFVICCP